MGRAGIFHHIPEELRKKHRGCRAGVKVKARLATKRWKYKPSVPSIVMGNVNCLTNKTDELATLVRTDRMFRECSLLCLSETWLTQNTPDANVDLPGFTTVRADRDCGHSGKSNGGGLTLFINNRWCNQGHVTVKEIVCNRDIEMLVVGLRLYYMPREFSHAIAVVVYVPPRTAEGSGRISWHLSTAALFCWICVATPTVEITKRKKEKAPIPLAAAQSRKCEMSAVGNTRSHSHTHKHTTSLELTFPECDHLFLAGSSWNTLMITAQACKPGNPTVSHGNGLMKVCVTTRCLSLPSPWRSVRPILRSHQSDRWYHLRPPNSATRHTVIHHHSNSACHCLGSEGLLGQMEREATRLAVQHQVAVMTGMSVTGAPSWKLQNKMSQASSKRIVEFDPFCAKPLTHKMDALAMEGQTWGMLPPPCLSTISHS
ncbi:unnamed protein product [Leuciscus chuanchicus]